MTLVAALRARFAPPAYALLEEVRNATGHSANRSADAIAVSLWPSRGLEIIGIECKSFRSDWLRELKNPAKAETIQAYCDRWWIAAADAEVVKEAEIPPTWGLLVLRGEKLVQVVAAPQLEPKPLDRKFVAALLRRAGEYEERLRKEWTSPEDAAAAADKRVAGELEWRRKDWEREAAEELGRLREKVKRLDHERQDFEDATGLKWNERGSWPEFRRRHWNSQSREEAGSVKVSIDEAVRNLKSAESAVERLRDAIMNVNVPAPAPEVVIP